MNATPPDYIFLVHKDTSEFGAIFGRDYGRKLYKWIVKIMMSNRSRCSIWLEPLQSNRFGIRLLIPRSSA